MIRIGLISDTHGLLRAEAMDVLRGSDFIVHAGDIGENVLEPLSTIAPVTAVRGNNDRATVGRSALRKRSWLRFGEVTLQVLHDLADLAVDPKAAGVDVVVTRAIRTVRRSNAAAACSTSTPAARGPVRFKLPVSVALMQIVTGADVARSHRGTGVVCARRDDYRQRPAS